VLALSLLLFLVFGLILGRQWYDSLLARLDYGQLVHRDESELESGVTAQVPPRVALIYRERDGETVRVLMDADRYSAFVDEYSRNLAAAEVRLRRQTRRRLQREMDLVFAGPRGRIGAFADWYFAYGTSYGLLWEALASAVGHAVTAEAQSLGDAVAYDLEQYLRSQYRRLVLKPELTDPLLLEAYRRVLVSAHQGYLNVLAGLRSEFRLLVAEETDHLERPGGAVLMELDWSAQFSKLDPAALERGSPEVLRSGLLALGGAAAGKALGGALGKGVATKTVASGAGKGLFAKLAAPFASKAALAAGGGALGSLGGPVGTAVGAGAGVGVDYLINEGVELAQREPLEADLQAALTATQGEWQLAFEQSLGRAIGVWFGDTLQLLVRFEQ
jgi:hypothetical protein